MIETTARGPRTHLALKPKPKNFYGGPCRAAGCRRVEQHGGLCLPCGRIVAGDVAADLAEAGLQYEAADLDVTITPGLYVTVVIAGDRRRRQVHRVSMAAILGRPLIGMENVHHINGCKWDNSAANLELWVTCQPPGQRPADLAQYGRKLLAHYGTDLERAQHEAHR